MAGIKRLIGYQLLDLDEEKIIVRDKWDKEYILKIIQNDGDCCGYNELKTELYIDKNNLKLNPIITAIEYKGKNFEDDGDNVIVTFYGGNKELANIDSYSSSGSGWTYGACVSVECKDLGIFENISQW